MGKITKYNNNTALRLVVQFQGVALHSVIWCIEYMKSIITVMTAQLRMLLVQL